MKNEMSFHLIINIFSDISFECDRQTDRRTYGASYRGAMAHLEIILAYFWIFSSDFCSFRDFQLERDVTDRPTNQPTDQRTEPIIEMRGRI